MLATHTALIPFLQLSLSAQKCDVFPALQKPLLSLCQLRDAGFSATLDSETVQLTKDGIETLLGNRYHINGLFFIVIEGYPNYPHSLYQQLPNQYYMYSPVQSTLYSKHTVSQTACTT